MAFVFDMRRLHHGCGESLLVRPLKPECSFRSGSDEERQKSGKVRLETSSAKTESAERHWE